MRRLDIDLIHSAIIFATNAHKGQLRKGTDLPYIIHPMEVMQILCEMEADEVLKIAGVLHDTLEDTDTTEEEIEKLFGEKVLRLVKSNSENKTLSWQERKQHTIDELKTAPLDVQMLILADKLSNMKSLLADYTNQGEDLWKRFNAPKRVFKNCFKPRQRNYRRFCKICSRSVAWF